MKKLCLPFLLFLSACSGNKEASFSAIEQSIAKPAANEAQLIMYRPDNMKMMVYPADISIDGKQVCNLGNHKYFVINVPVKTMEISASTTLMPGTSRFSFTPQAGAQHYIAIEGNNEKIQMMGAWDVFGLIEGEKAEGNKGPYYFYVDEQSAKSDIAGATKDDSCSKTL